MTLPVPPDCTGFEPDLSALLDAELPAAREAELRAHCATCARCRAQLAALARVDVLLAAEPVRETGASLHAQLRARIEAETREQARSEVTAALARGTQRPRSEPARRARPWLAAVFAAAAALALYLALGRPRTPLAPEPEPRVAQLTETIAVPELPTAPDPDFDPVPADEIALGLELDTAEDLDVIANLELLEALVVLEEGRG